MFVFWKVKLFLKNLAELKKKNFDNKIMSLSTNQSSTSSTSSNAVARPTSPQALRRSLGVSITKERKPNLISKEQIETMLADALASFSYFF